MHTSITVNWWALALRGLAALVLGILCFALTGMALSLLVALFAAYLLIDGLFALFAAVRGRSWFLGLEGLFGIAAGIIAFLLPGLTALVLALLIAVWAILTGIVEIYASFHLRKVIRNEWMLGLGGVLSIIFGLLMAIFPGAGLVTIIYLIGAYAILWGVMLLILALTLRGSRGVLRVTS